MEHILNLMTVECKHGFLMTLLGPMSRSSPNLKKLVFFSVSLRSVSYNSGHAAIQVGLMWEEGWGGGHDKLCKLFWRDNTFLHLEWGGSPQNW